MLYLNGLKIPFSGQPLLQTTNLEVIGLVEKGRIETNVMSVGLIIEQGKDRVAEIAKDVLK